MSARPVPALAKAKPLKLPAVTDTLLDNGLRVLVVRRPGVPLVEVRLRVPFAADSPRRAAAHLAQAQLMSDTMLLGTQERDAATLARDLQALGGQLSVGADVERLGFGGSVLASELRGYLALLAEVLTSASYPRHEVGGERDRLVQELAIHRSQAGVIAREALLERMYGDHPYAHDLPDTEHVEKVSPRRLRDLHERSVGPAGAVLVLVGDVSPARAAGLVAEALSSWTATGTSAPLAAVPEQQGRRALLLDRPGAVQTTMRFGGGAPTRTAPDYAATVLANLVFGGYFSSRWVSNIREDKGYTYSPHSNLEHPTAGSRLVAGADVATEVTAPALLETLYELGRIATVPVGQEELDQARRYALGTLALGTSSQAGIAGQVSQLAGVGLELGWLKEHAAALQRVGVDDVLEAAARWLAPAVLTPVLVGDASVVAGSVASLVDLET